jgi:curved DNA-binding protein CbpA
MAGQRDYYQVLGVPRDADAKAIKNAFRRLARRLPPPGGGNSTSYSAPTTRQARAVRTPHGPNGGGIASRHQ